MVSEFERGVVCWANKSSEHSGSWNVNCMPYQVVYYKDFPPYSSWVMAFAEDGSLLDPEWMSRENIFTTEKEALDAYIAAIHNEIQQHEWRIERLRKKLPREGADR